MSTRYGNKIGPLITRQTSFFKKNRFDAVRIKRPTAGGGSSWTRPADWLAMPSFSPSEQKIAMLMPVFPQGSNFLAFTIQGAYTVDWGDGATENFASGVKAQHEYSYNADELDTTITSDGYKMAVVVVTPQAGQNLTSVDFNQKYALTGSTFPNSSPILEVIFSCPNLSASGFILGNATATNVFCKQLQSFVSLHFGSLNSMADAFRNLTSLESVVIQNADSVTNMSGMFQGCTSLTTVPLFNTANVTNISFMFSGCNSLTTVPQFNTSLVTAMNSMFQGCTSLTTVPLFNTASVTDMNGMFSNCNSLTTVPQFNTSLVTNMSGMFQNCTSLTTVPLFNTANVTNISFMFSGCRSLATVPQFNTSLVTAMNSMFSICNSLTTVPLFNTSLVTAMNGMFSGCNSLTTVPQFNTSLVTNISFMFQSCTSLTTVPLFNTASVTDMNGMFSNCNSLTTVPLFNTASVTNMITMFGGCRSLATVPLFNTSLVTAMNSMFNSCTRLTTVPQFNTSLVTNMNSMFNGCTRLTTVSFDNVGADGGPTSKFGNVFANCVSLTRGFMGAAEYSISYSGCKISKEELESIFNGLDTIGTAGQVITITNNWGAPTPATLTGTSTAGSVTITMTNTTGIVAGMQVTGTGSPLNTARAVTFTAAGSTVNLASHLLQNGDEVSFATIVTTTGIVINRIYRVINATAGTFQLSNTIDGPAITLTNNGSGTMRYRTEVVSIIPNSSVTLSRPMASNVTTSFAFRQLKTGTALLKGWTVTG